MYKLLLLGALLTGLTGCATTTGWHPKSEYEMRILIGETMFLAMDQYDIYLQVLEDLGKEGPLKGLENAPNKWY